MGVPEPENSQIRALLSNMIEGAAQQPRVIQTQPAIPATPKTMSNKPCLKCGHVDEEDTNFCTKCGNDLRSKPCSKCGHVDDEDTKFCTNCGNNLGEATQVKPAKPTPKLEELEQKEYHARRKYEEDFNTNNQEGLAKSSYKCAKAIYKRMKVDKNPEKLGEALRLAARSAELKHFYNHSEKSVESSKNLFQKLTKLRKGINTDYK